MDLDNDELKETKRLNGTLEDNCLHCGTGEVAYCEKCYQELISINMKLQCELNKYKKEHALKLEQKNGIKFEFKEI